MNNLFIGIGAWIKSHILISVIIGVVFVGGTIGIIVLTNKKESTPSVEDKQEKNTIILKDNLSFEINSELTLLALVSEDNKVKILSEDEIIDTSVLGEKDVILKYKMEDDEKEIIVKINIVDTISPTIEFEKELSTYLGTKIDLLKEVKATDNSEEEIEVTVEGDYDFNKVGTYTLKYVAVDSSGNKKEEEFVLKVTNKETTSSTSNNSNNDNNSSTSAANNSSSNNTSNNNSNNSVDENSKYDINLNDNVMYYESIADACSVQYIPISSVCWNKTLDQLKTTFPNYDKTLDQNMIDWGVSGNEVFHSGYLDYFPECEESISQSTITSINGKLKGYKVKTGVGQRVKFNELIFKDYKYEKYKSFIDIESYRLEEYGGCGDDSDITYEVLDEAMCSKYNLSCGRW